VCSSDLLEVYQLSKEQTIGKNKYKPEDSYVIPVNQTFSATVKTLMANVTEFEDSTFYDISTWTFPHAFNLQYDELKSVSALLGDKIEQPVFAAGTVIGGQSSVAYVFDNSQYYSSKVILDLLKQGLIVKVSKKPFTYPNDGKPVTFGYGSIMVPLQNQPLTGAHIYQLMQDLAAECGVDIYSLNTGLLPDIDLGSPAWSPIKLPRVAIITGSGMGIPESGEAWMLLGRRFNLPPTLIDNTALANVDWSKYNVVIMADGSPSRALSQAVTDRITHWVEDGGILIATGSAYSWTNKAKLTNLKTVSAAKKDSTATTYQSYASRSGASAGNAVDGVILRCRLDYTHPLAWGYDQEEIAVFRQGSIAFEPSKNVTASPLSYLKKPYLSGCISAANLQKIGGSPAIITTAAGKGQVIYFADDMNFRMYYYGTTKLFMNAILFGQLL
jgi:hypothetical protein